MLRSDGQSAFEGQDLVKGELQLKGFHLNTMIRQHGLNHLLYFPLLAHLN